MNEKKIFPNLNGVRAIAAFMVIFFHIELIKREFGYSNIVGSLNLAGEMSVVLFFVLSGFLITYLLLNENFYTNKINLPNFYIRRVLRIWPLYFFVVLTSLFILPQFSFMYEPPYHAPMIHDRFTIITCYLFLGGNILTGLYSHLNFIRPTWSVSVEEQFYLYWPILIKLSKNTMKAIGKVLIFYWLIRIILGLLCTNPFITYSHYLEWISALELIWIYTPFDALSIGAMSAYILHTKQKIILNLIFKKPIQYVTFILIPILLFLVQFQPSFLLFNKVIYYHSLFYSFLFAFCIINLAANSEVIIRLENYYVSYLGKISYGLYLYHWIVIVAVINFLRLYKLDNLNSILFNFLIYFISIILTCFIAFISYNLFELKFINLKRKFTMLPSKYVVKEKTIDKQKIHPIYPQLQE